ncbi:MAG: family 16 glycoside hydrolase, partial [Akkermansiaceae bacterium]
MKLIAIILAATASFSFAGEWIQMFDGKTLKGWKVNSENPQTFSVEDGAIKVEGPRAHLFYGADGNAKFKNFEFECEVKTAKNAN